MKTTILLGWAKTDASGNPIGAPEVISGPPADDAAARAQSKIFTDAKHGQKFPAGVRFVGFANVEITSAAADTSKEETKKAAAKSK